MVSIDEMRQMQDQLERLKQQVQQAALPVNSGEETEEPAKVVTNSPEKELSGNIQCVVSRRLPS